MDANLTVLERLLRACLDNKLVVGILTGIALLWGVLVAPFDWDVDGLPRDPVPVDAIPDTGENQQIVFTEWPGRSPQDIEDQVTYPLTVSLLSVPGVKTVRSSSMFGFSSIAVIFDDDIEFYWSRSRILERIASLGPEALPDSVRPTLGPDATALGQVFWYTLEGRDTEGRPTGGWDLRELRTVQDWYVRYALASVDGVAEVASVGGFVQEYQIDVDPDAMRAHAVTLPEIFSAVRRSNLDVGARTIELNRVEYVVRGLGFLESVDDIEQTVVKVRDNVPITIRQVATVALGPALRRGALDREGAEAVGGVVVARYGANPLAVIERVKDKIRDIDPGMAAKTLADGTVSKLAIVPFYDRSGLIRETLGTLETALTHEILVTIIVVLVLIAHFRTAVLISGLLPLAVLMCFVAMRYTGVDANIVALSGIAIAIGTMVDMAIVVCENVLRRIRDDDTPAARREAVFRGVSEVGGAVLTAVMTTVVSFLPVFTMHGEEGKLFQPLAFTKTFALLASLVVALVVLPPVAHLLLLRRDGVRRSRWLFRGGLAAAALLVGWKLAWWLGALVLGVAVWHTVREVIPAASRTFATRTANWIAAITVGVVLTLHWEPLGPTRDFANLTFVTVLFGGLLLAFWAFQRSYESALRWCLSHKTLFLSVPIGLIVLGALIWRDLGDEVMPKLDEGSYLLMPVMGAHASIGEAVDVIRVQDARIATIPEVESVVGKIGRAESPLDPAPISMVETVVNYRSEYVLDADGRRRTFAWDAEAGAFVRDGTGELVPDPDGRPFRQWRDHIESPRDIFDEIESAARLTGLSGAGAEGPIAIRRAMLATGVNAAMAVKVFGSDLQTIERVTAEIARLLQQVPSVDASAVVAKPQIGKPYLEIDIDREAIARYGLDVQDVQDVVEVAVGGKRLTTTVEGRERYPVRVRYLRELRDDYDSLERILVAAPGGAQVPLGQLAAIRYTPGPESIRSEGTFHVGYVTFSTEPGLAEVDVVEACQRHLAANIVVPSGISYAFAGRYETWVRASETLRLVVPLSLAIIFVLLYLLFRSAAVTLMVFSGVFVAWAGGFILLWLYGQPWFLDFSVFGTSMRELFDVHTINLSVAVWVGFLALFGIATDDGVIMGSYLRQSFRERSPRSVEAVREAVVAAGKRRIRPCLLTSATTILALIPVLTSTGRGSDVMVPMAIPSFGGMAVVLITVFVVPTLYCAAEEAKARRVSRSTAAVPAE